VDSYGDLTNHLLFFLLHMFERFHCWYYRYYRYYIYQTSTVEATTRASAASVFNILRLFLPSVDSYGDLTNHLLFFLFHMFERFHCWYYGIMVLWYYDIMVLWYYGIMILWYYGIISIKHRLWKRPPERAQRASLTSSVHSYLRWILTATSPTIYYSFYFTCSRDFIVSIMVLWYYELVFEYINLSNIDCGSECQSERSERL
jgi:hypothetical protein